MDILKDFEDALLELFKGVMPLREQQQRPHMTYPQYVAFCGQFFHFNRDKPPLLSAKQLAQIFIAVKKDGGGGEFPDSILFPEFMVLLGVVAVGATTHMFQHTNFHRESAAIERDHVEDKSLFAKLYRKFGLDEESSVKWLMQRMYNSEGVKNDKLRCAHTFKAKFCDMWREDGLPTNYLNPADADPDSAQEIARQAALDGMAAVVRRRHSLKTFA